MRKTRRDVAGANGGRYDPPVSPARDQLERAGVPPIDRIILSHSHWDHVAAIEDFPAAEIWVPREELEVIEHPSSNGGGAWPSQVSGAAIRWKTFEFASGAYENFAQSHDLFGDGRVVLCPCRAHPRIVCCSLRSTVQAFFFCGGRCLDAAPRRGAPEVGLRVPIATRTRPQAERVSATSARCTSEPRLRHVPRTTALCSGAGYFQPGSLMTRLPTVLCPGAQVKCRVG